MKKLLIPITCLALATALVVSCGGSSDDDDGGGDGSTVAGSGSSGNGTGTGATGSLDGSLGAGADNSGTGNGNGNGEVCDGKDNDGDGIIDNVDAGGDGICDCLNIGTIGSIGPWSNGGNIFKEWLDTRSPLPAKEIGDGTLTAEEIAGLDVIVVLRADTAPLETEDVTSPAHHEFAEGEVSALESWVRAGGGLLTTIGYQGDEAAEVENVNRLLAPFGLGYSTTQLDLNGFIEDWSAHAISEGVERVRTDNGAEPDDSNGTVVARGAEDRVAMVVDEVDSGHVIVFGDEWITYDSEWADLEDQQVERLWLNMIKWLSPPARCQVPLPPIVK